MTFHEKATKTRGPLKMDLQFFAEQNGQEGSEGNGQKGGGEQGQNVDGRIVEDMFESLKTMQDELDHMKAEREAQKRLQDAHQKAQEAASEQVSQEQKEAEMFNETVSRLAKHYADEERKKRKSKVMFPVGQREGNLSKTDKQLLDVVMGRKALYHQGSFGQKTTITTGGTGSEWVPTELGTEILRDVKDLVAIPNVYREIPMPSNPFSPPTRTGRADVNYTDENTKIEENQNDFIGNVTLDAKKMTAYVPVSTEEGEDAIVAVLPEIRAAIAEGIAEERDNFHINGVVNGQSVPGVTGLYDAAGVSKTIGTVGSGGVAVAKNFLTARSALGKYGINPRNLVWVVGYNTYNHLVELDALTTVDKYGPNATILTGEVGKFWGSTVVVSSQFNTDSTQYDSTNGYNAYTENSLLTHKRAALLGNRRQLQIKSDEKILYDRIDLVGTMRIAHELTWGGALAAMNVVYRTDD